MNHSSAKASHYDKDAAQYDIFNEKNSAIINHTIEKILKKYKVHTVLDMTCGTGSQVFWLAKRGFEVTGSDINSKMLTIAKRKALVKKYPVEFFKKDIRTAQLGEFDAVITIFNAIGHLTKRDFEKAVRNIYNNLKPGGLYIFDINNLNYLLKGNNITHLTIDWQEATGNKKIREIQYSTINKAGILASYTTSYIQKNDAQPKIIKQAQTLQVYTASQLTEILQQNEFKVIGKFAIDGKKFMETKSDRILMIAKK
ncbi:MAG: class I SAM-dependent methyltransferase [Legionellales bacterium]|jgi:ubiquinone/menaquinone biosynthesis C-methylase UbiE